MKMLLLFVVLISHSLVLGLPVKDHIRSVHFGQESNEKANTLLQDFNTLSDELRVVEEELKDSIQVNEMDNTNFHPLAESQPSVNIQEDASDQELEYLNRHFQALKEQLMGQPSDQVQQQGKSMWDEWNDDGPEQYRQGRVYVSEEEEPEQQPDDKANLCDEMKKKTLEYPQSNELDDISEIAVEAIKKEEPGFTGFPQRYIHDPENHWYCFEYDQSFWYAIVHIRSDSGEPHAEPLIGQAGEKDICYCDTLAQKKIKQEEKNGDKVDTEPKVPEEEDMSRTVNQQGESESMWDDDGPERYQQGRVYVSEEEEPEQQPDDKANLCDEMKKNTLEYPQSNELDDISKIAVEAIKKEEPGFTGFPQRYIHDPENHWYCFEYDQSFWYAIVHIRSDSGEPHAEPLIGQAGERDICYCDTLAQQKIKQEEKNGEKVDTEPDVPEKDMSQTVNQQGKSESMWDEWNDDGPERYRQGRVYVSEEEEPEQQPSDNMNCKEAGEDYPITGILNLSFDIRMVANAIKDKYESFDRYQLPEQYIHDPENQWYCFKYGQDLYGLLHSTDNIPLVAKAEDGDVPLKDMCFCTTLVERKMEAEKNKGDKSMVNAESNNREMWNYNDRMVAENQWENDDFKDQRNRWDEEESYNHAMVQKNDFNERAKEENYNDRMVAENQWENDDFNDQRNRWDEKESYNHAMVQKNDFNERAKEENYNDRMVAENQWENDFNDQRNRWDEEESYDRPMQVQNQQNYNSVRRVKNQQGEENQNNEWYGYNNEEDRAVIPQMQD